MITVSLSCPNQSMERLAVDWFLSDRHCTIMDVTSFGAGTDSPTQAAALLRAMGMRFGAVCMSVPDVKLAAAVGAAELWTAASGVPRLDRASSAGPDAVAVLAAALRLACEGRVPERRESWWCAEWDRYAEVMERVNGWFALWLDDQDASTAWTIVAAVLSVAGDELFTSVAELATVFHTTNAY
jgi:hypothetical protein